MKKANWSTRVLGAKSRCFLIHHIDDSLSLHSPSEDVDDMDILHTVQAVARYPR